MDPMSSPPDPARSVCAPTLDEASADAPQRARRQLVLALMFQRMRASAEPDTRSFAPLLEARDSGTVPARIVKTDDKLWNSLMPVDLVRGR